MIGTTQTYMVAHMYTLYVCVIQAWLVRALIYNVIYQDSEDQKLY